MTVKVGRGRPRRSISSVKRPPRLNEKRVRKCVLLFRIMLQEVLLIRICTVNVQGKWEPKNI